MSQSEHATLVKDAVVYHMIGRRLDPSVISEAIRAGIRAHPLGISGFAYDTGLNHATIWRIKNGGDVSLGSYARIDKAYQIGVQFSDPSEQPPCCGAERNE